MNIEKAMSTKVIESKILAIYNKYYTTMYKVAYSITKDESNSSDAVQEAFISITNNINLLDNVETASTKTLVCIIQWNKAIDIIRKLPQYQKISNNEFDDIIFNYYYDNEKNLNCNYLNNIINKSSSKIHPQYQHVLILYYIQNRTVKEISLLLGKPIKTIYSWLLRGKKELSSILKMQGLNHEEINKK